jgi:hypothetical protein
MKKNGIEIDGGLIGEFADFGRFGVQQIGDIFTYSKWLSLGLGAIVAVSVGALIFQLATKSSVRREAVDIGTTVATRGLNKV